MMDRQRLIGECTKLKETGVDLENIISYLRSEGCWKIDTIAILREVLDISLGDAKSLVHYSSAWRDVREQDDAFHDQIIQDLVETPETRL
jgi:ribosomal protein L7/L12